MTLRIITYIEDEVERQGYTRLTAEWKQRVDWMFEAWIYAIDCSHQLFVDRDHQPFTMADIIRLGYLVERKKNHERNFRQVSVRVGERICPDWSLVPHMIDSLVEHQTELDPDSFYKAFEDCHPFRDGNGRTGKILFNWLKGTLLNPVLPPNFYGVVNL